MNCRMPVLVMVILSGCASAPPSEPTIAAAVALENRFEPGPGPYAFDCDARRGQYDERNAHTPGDIFVVKGFVQFVGLQTDEKWAPMAAVEVAGNGPKSNIGIVAFVNPYQPGKIQIGVRNIPGGVRDPVIFATRPFSNEAIPFDISVIGPGRLTASIGDAKRTVTFKKTVLTRARMTCSTGHVRFSNVAVASSQ